MKTPEFDRNITNRLDKDPNKISLGIQQASSIIEKELLNKRPSLDEFKDIKGYSPEEIKKDKERVKWFKEHEPSPTTPNIRKTAQVLEGLVALGSEFVFGPDVNVALATEYDDIFNGVDLALTIKHKDTEILAASLDVTFGKKVDDKLNRIFTEIQHDKGASIKYLKTPTFTGKQEHVARGVIALELDSLREFAALLISDRISELKNHPLRRIIIDELSMQMRGFHHYAKANNKPHMTAAYEQAMTIMDLLQKRGQNVPLKNDMFDAHKDKQFEVLKHRMQPILKEIRPTGRILQG